MNLKFWYIKFVGLLLVTLGFGNSLIVFYKLFDVIFADKIILANTNLLVTGLGSIFPLFIFIFGMFFYFYCDIYQEKPKRLICGLKLLLMNDSLCNAFGVVGHLLDFVHVSFAYGCLVLGLLLIYGHIKYKY